MPSLGSPRAIAAAIATMLLVILTVPVYPFHPPLSFQSRHEMRSSAETNDQMSALTDRAARAAVVASLLTAAIVFPAFADEYGKETEAPTLFTGETVMVRHGITMTSLARNDAANGCDVSTLFALLCPN